MSSLSVPRRRIPFWEAVSTSVWVGLQLVRVRVLSVGMVRRSSPKRSRDKKEARSDVNAVRIEFDVLSIKRADGAL